MDEEDLIELVEGETDARHSTDPALPAAKKHLLETYFSPGTKRVYYQRQLQVLAEREFFHWITALALADLAREGAIETWLSHRLPAA